MKILTRPPAKPWPTGALVSVLSPIDSDPATPCKSYKIEERERLTTERLARKKSRTDAKRVTIETTPNDSLQHAGQRQE